MNDISLPIAGISAVWLAAVFYVVRLCQTARFGSVGLPAAFLFSTTFLYCSVFLYAVPGYTHLRIDAPQALTIWNISEDTVLTGAWVTLVGIVGFAVGVRLHATVLVSEAAGAKAWRNLASDADTRRPLRVFGAFAIVGFLIPYLHIDIPIAQALQQIGQNVGIVIVCLGYLQAWQRGNRRAQLYWLGASMLIPVWYLVVWGFVSYGFIAATIIGAFHLSTTRLRFWGPLRTAAVLLVTTYACLSLFTLYMGSRDEIRGVIWTGASLSDRLDVLGKTLSGLTILNPFDFSSLDLINLRLNQGAFVGKVAEWHEIYPDLRTWGSSLILSLFAWVPRALWPEKPEMGGSKMLEINSGLRFSETTTFGSGEVIEFYVNFGTAGVFFGFLVLGLLISRFDMQAAIALHRRRFNDCIRNFAIGIALMTQLTELFFIISTCIATWLAIKGITMATSGTRTLPPKAPVAPHAIRR